VSAVAGSQVTHVPPPVPHVASDGLSQMSPTQQPFGHVVASQPRAAVRQPACSWKDVLAESPPASEAGGRQSVTAKLAEVDRPPPVLSASLVMRKLALDDCANAAEAETSNTKPVICATRTSVFFIVLPPSSAKLKVKRRKRCPTQCKSAAAGSLAVCGSRGDGYTQVRHVRRLRAIRCGRASAVRAM
jgi:hypothetical protein